MSIEVSRKSRRLGFALALLTSAGVMSACRQDLFNQPKQKPLSASDFFEDGRAARPAVRGTIPRGHLNLDTHLYEGRAGGKLATTFPFPITVEVMKRGRERYNIFCAPCHDRVGQGMGMIVRRGFRQPPSFHMDRLRAAPAGHFYDVITNGLGAMTDYSDKIPVEDRWAIVAYIRALQLSQKATPADVPPDVKQKLREEAEQRAQASAE